MQTTSLSKKKLLAHLATWNQPDPKVNQLTPSWVMAMQRIQHKPDLLEAFGSRVEFGYNQYGGYIHPQNGRCPYVECLQEALDLLNYLPQASVEMQINNESQDRIDAIEDCFVMAAAIAETMIKLSLEKHGTDTGSE